MQADRKTTIERQNERKSSEICPTGRRSLVVFLRPAAGFSTTTPSFVTFFSLYATIRYLSMSAYLLGVLRHLCL